MAVPIQPPAFTYLAALDTPSICVASRNLLGTTRHRPTMNQATAGNAQRTFKVRMVRELNALRVKAVYLSNPDFLKIKRIIIAANNTNEAHFSITNFFLRFAGKSFKSLRLA